MNNQNRLLRSKHNKSYFLTGLISTLLTAGIIFCLFALTRMAPFGNRALLYLDGNQQMVDLFSWYRDVLSGHASIDYSFSKSLGGSNFAVFSYYLASPCNLLMVFFGKSETSLFLNILFVIKSTLAAWFATYYLLRRFRPTEKLQYCITILLATSYALSPFFISQSSLSMWLDGAFMLPLILAGCEKIVSGKHSTQFSICVALALCFNWYSGILDLLFACFWLLFETIRRALREKGLKGKDILNIFIHYGISCVIALLLSALILLPTLCMLSGRSYGSSGLSMLKDLTMIDHPINALTGYAFGLTSFKGTVSLFAGSFVLIGIGMLFLAGSRSLKEKWLNGSLLLFTILMFFWQPLVALFSMLRVVDSYWYRYTYLGCFALIVLAAEYYLHETFPSPTKSEQPIVKSWLPFCIALIFVGLIYLLSKFKAATTPDILFYLSLNKFTGGNMDYDVSRVLGKIIFPFLIGLLISLFLRAQKDQILCKRILAGMIACSTLLELTLGLVFLTDFYSIDMVDSLTEYTRNELNLLQYTGEDPQQGRVVQTTYHGTHFNVPSSYNEAMAYGFRSVVSFVSDPDEHVLSFLNRSGYPAYVDTITITADDNLALDSLLHVQYILLDDEDTHTTGLTYVAGIEGFKTLYQNPYLAPEAFTYTGTGDYDSNCERPYEYLNELYRKLSGIKQDIYTPVAYIETQEDHTYHYEINLGDDFDPNSQILYANLVTNTDSGANVYVNGEQYSYYSYVLTPQQIRIQTVDNQAHVDLVFNDNQKNIDTFAVTDPQFYVLSLPALAQATDAMNQRACTQYEIEDSHCSFTVSGHEGDSLFTTIPAEKGWTVTRNGQKITPDEFGQALMSIPLIDGENQIEMTYQVPFKKVGICLSLIGILLLGGMYYVETSFLKKNSSDCETQHSNRQ